jgi:uncharacterized membrane protein
MRITVKKIAVSGVLSALVIVLSITNLGFIPLPSGAAVTILQVPAIIGAVLEGPLVGFFIGLLFGVSSIIISALSAATPIDLAFVSYPFIAIIPRILIGPAAWFFYALIAGKMGKRGMGENEKKESAGRECAGIAVAGVSGSLVNTGLVIAGLGLVKVAPWTVLALVAATNGTLEAAASAFIVFGVVTAWKRIAVGRGKSKLSKWEKKDRNGSLPLQDKSS